MFSVRFPVLSIRLQVTATLLGAVALLSASAANATIIGGSLTGGSAFTAGGLFVKLTPPLPNPFGPANSVGNDTFQSPNLFGFDEDQNILLLAPLDTNIGLDPIPAGTVIASHYIFFDPAQNQQAIGTVDFDSAIVSIITGVGNLSASDFLANTGVNYLNPAARGLEPGDTVTISGTNQISVNFTAGSPGDYIRVITAFSPTAAAAPEPTSASLLVFLGAGILMRRRRR